MLLHSELELWVGRSAGSVSIVIEENFKIRSIIEYPDTQEEGGGRERIGCKAGGLGLSLDLVKENFGCVFFFVFLENEAGGSFFFSGFRHLAVFLSYFSWCMLLFLSFFYFFCHISLRGKGREGERDFG
jgi:hypothetical protein